MRKRKKGGQQQSHGWRRCISTLGRHQLPSRFYVGVPVAVNSLLGCRLRLLVVVLISKGVVSENVSSCLPVDVNRISFVVTSNGVLSLDVFLSCLLSVAVARFRLLV